jgi:proteic killer suppression protein
LERERQRQVERAERSGGLHKRSAEAWGDCLRARGGSAPLGCLSTVSVRVSAHEFEGRALRGRTQAPHGWEAENARHYGRLQRGKGAAPFPKKYENDVKLLTSVRLQATVVLVRIRNFVHKGLKKLYADDATKGVPPDTVDKLRKMLAFLDDMEDPEELRMLPSWKAHTLTGDRKGTWSLSVTANRRLTFCVDTAEREIYDMNLEDYH